MIRVLEAQDRSFMQAVYRELLIIGRPFSVLQCHAKRVKSKLRKSTEKSFLYTLTSEGKQP